MCGLLNAAYTTCDHLICLGSDSWLSLITDNTECLQHFNLTWRMRHNQTSWMGDTRNVRIHWTTPVALNSPHLNPVDYKIWGEMHKRVYQTKVHDLDELKQRLIDGWGQNIIDEAIDEWRKHLCACIRAKGRHFEHLLWHKGTHMITLVC